MKEPVLITGACGFIGSHLSERLLKRGHPVTGIDNLQTSSIENIKHLEKYSGWKFIVSDIREKIPVAEKMRIIFNLACPASPIHYQNSPIDTILTNIMGSLNVLNFARSCEARVVQASTSEIYGDALEHPQTEGYFGNVNTVGPRSCYDEGKRAAETLFYEFNKNFGVDIQIVRIFNTYGPNMARSDGRVVSEFVIRALEGRALEIYGLGEQTRSFCYVDDLVDGLIAVSELGEKYTGPINLGNPDEMTINHIAALVLEKTKSKSEIVYHPARIDEPRKRKPDITRARQLLGWAPKVGLNVGLNRTIQYFMKPEALERTA